ncbi:hypothetical protein ACLH0A_20525, partial [Aeromonas media]
PLQAAPAPWWPAQEAPGWHAFSLGRYQEAARAFQDPVWQGNAWYRAGDHARAVAAYGRADTATAHYNRGNALVWLGDLKGAELAYLAALKRWLLYTTDAAGDSLRVVVGGCLVFKIK